MEYKSENINIYKIEVKYDYQGAPTASGHGVLYGTQAYAVMPGQNPGQGGQTEFESEDLAKAVATILAHSNRTLVVSIIKEQKTIEKARVY